MDLHDFRREYLLAGLERSDLDADPIIQFEKWFNEILKLGNADPTAMVLATVENQQPDQRIVLLKQVDQQGFTFFTNQTSDKARAMASNPNVSLHFPWHSVERQVKVMGTVELLPASDNIEYFKSRPRGSQLAAWASFQSRPLTSRQQLLDRYHAKQAQYPDEIPAPDFWGGYRVVPQLIEFWQGGEHRLHDRFVYERTSTGWTITRLSP